MGSKGLGGHARIQGGGGGGAGGLDPIGKSHVVWVDLDLYPLLPLTKFPGSAHVGGGAIYLTGMHQNRLPNRGPGSGGDSIPARGLGLAENEGFHMA